MGSGCIIWKTLCQYAHDKCLLVFAYEFWSTKKNPSGNLAAAVKCSEQCRGCSIGYTEAIISQNELEQPIGLSPFILCDCLVSIFPLCIVSWEYIEEKVKGSAHCLFNLAWSKYLTWCLPSALKPQCGSLVRLQYRFGAKVNLSHSPLSLTTDRHLGFQT